MIAPSNGNVIKFLCRELVSRCEEYEALRKISNGNVQIPELKKEITWLYSEIANRQRRLPIRQQCA